MRIKVIPAFLFFLGSYFPLAVIWVLQDLDYVVVRKFIVSFLDNGSFCSGNILERPIISLSVLFVTFLGLVTSLVALWTAGPKIEYVILDSKPIPSELMNYVLPYVVSFMSLEYQHEGKFVGAIVFMVWMFIISYRSDQIMLNPFFITLGWRPYEVKYRFAGDAREEYAVCLSRDKVIQNAKRKGESIGGLLLLKPEVTS